MLFTVVHSLNILEFEYTISILIHDVEGLESNFLTLGRHRSTNSANEFIVINCTLAIYVHSLEEAYNFGLVEP